MPSFLRVESPNRKTADHALQNLIIKVDVRLSGLSGAVSLLKINTFTGLTSCWSCISLIVEFVRGYHYTDLPAEGSYQ